MKLNVSKVLSKVYRSDLRSTNMLILGQFSQNRFIDVGTLKKKQKKLYV